MAASRKEEKTQSVRSTLANNVIFEICLYMHPEELLNLLLKTKKKVVKTAVIKQFSTKTSAELYDLALTKENKLTRRFLVRHLSFLKEKEYKKTAQMIGLDAPPEKKTILYSPRLPRFKECF